MPIGSSIKNLTETLERYSRTDLEYLLKGASWLLTNQAAAILSSLLLAIAFAHLATPDLYGNYKYALNIGALLGALSLTGLGTAIIPAAAKGREGVLAQSFWMSLRWSLGIIIIGFGAAFYYYLQGNLFAAAALVIAAVCTPLINSFALYNPFQIGLRDFKQNFIYGTAQLIITSVLLFCALFLGVSRAIYFVLIYFAITLVCSGIFYLLTLRRAKNNKTDNELFRYSSHLSLMNIVAAIADKIDSIVIFSILGPTQLAIYLYAIAIPEQIKNALKLLLPLSLPKFANRPLAEIRETIWWRIIQLGLLVGFALVAYIILAPYIFAILFPIFIESVPFSRLYAISIIFAVLIVPLSSVLQAHQKTGALHIISNVSSIALILITPPLAITWGITGVVVAQMTYRMLNAGLSIWQFVRISVREPR